MRSFFCDEPLHNDSKSCVKKVEKADFHLTSNEHQNPSTLRSIGNPIHGCFRQKHGGNERRRPEEAFFGTSKGGG